MIIKRMVYDHSKTLGQCSHGAPYACLANKNIYNVDWCSDNKKSLTEHLCTDRAGDSCIDGYTVQSNDTSWSCKDKYYFSARSEEIANKSCDDRITPVGDNYCKKCNYTSDSTSCDCNSDSSDDNEKCSKDSHDEYHNDSSKCDKSLDYKCERKKSYELQCKGKCKPKGRKFEVTFEHKNGHPWAHHIHKTDRAIAIDGCLGKTLFLTRGHIYIFHVAKSKYDCDYLYFTEDPRGGKPYRSEYTGKCYDPIPMSHSPEPTSNGYVVLRITDDTPKVFYYQSRSYRFCGGLCIVKD